MYKKDPTTGKTIRVEVEEDSMNKVAVEWVGFRVGNFSVFGSGTKTQYRFGNTQRVQQVYEEDLESVLQQKDFRRVNGNPTVVERPRRGMPPDIDKPITGPAPRQMSAAEQAARAATATRVQPPVSMLPKEGVVAEGSLKRGPGRPRKEETQEQPQIRRIPPTRDTSRTTKVDPRQFGL